MNAFMLGMQSINPKARLKFILINSWYDPPKEGDAAKALIDQGCDIITQHTDSPAPLQAAASRGVKAFGQSTDMSKFAPGTELTASTDVWAPYYIERIGDVLDGTWKSTDTWGGFDSGMLAMSPFTNMPDDVAALATADGRRHQVRQEQGLRRPDQGSERRRQGPRRHDDGRRRAVGHAVAGARHRREADLSTAPWLGAPDVRRPLLTMTGITKQYPGCLANDHVSLTVEHNQIHALLGENGAGKSTLVKIIYGVVKPDEGEIVWEGQKVTIQNPGHAQRLGIGMVFQHFSLFEALTVTENIALGLRRREGARGPARADRQHLHRIRPAARSRTAWCTTCPSASASASRSCAACCRTPSC